MMQTNHWTFDHTVKNKSIKSNDTVSRSQRKYPNNKNISMDVDYQNIT